MPVDMNRRAVYHEASENLIRRRYHDEIPFFCGYPLPLLPQARTLEYGSRA